jgi:hypothetical protein
MALWCTPIGFLVGVKRGAVACGKATRSAGQIEDEDFGDGGQWAKVRPVRSEVDRTGVDRNTRTRVVGRIDGSVCDGVRGTSAWHAVIVSLDDVLRSVTIVKPLETLSPAVPCCRKSIPPDVLMRSSKPVAEPGPLPISGFIAAKLATNATAFQRIALV